MLRTFSNATLHNVKAIRWQRPCRFPRLLHQLANNTSETGRKEARNSFLRAAFVTSVAAVTLVHFTTRRDVHNDANVNEQPKATQAAPEVTDSRLKVSIGGVHDDEGPLACAWGSNKNGLIFPADSVVDSVKTPTNIPWLSVALRDLALHEMYGACVDASGNLYEWGAGFDGQENNSVKASRPRLVLQGHDIVKIQLTSSRIFALSANGKVYALPASLSAQDDLRRMSSLPQHSSWSSYLWGSKNADAAVVDLSPFQPFARAEKFTAISAGKDHVLALTSNGRVFAHPISSNANSHGQLGLRKITVSYPSASATEINLLPKAVADPFYNKTSQARRPSLPPPNATSPVLAPEALSAPFVNDDIRFCTHFYEVPSLRGLNVTQVVAGSRTSYVRTANEGRVLSWGANEHGQLGLGSTMTLDMIAIPTEVVLSRSAPATSRSHCLDITAGGDLAFFTVLRQDGLKTNVVDVLACGMGQWGGIGHGLFTTSQGEPARVQTVSGILEYNGETKTMEALKPHAMSVSPKGHVLLTLDTLPRAGPGRGAPVGRDLLAWGLNQDYQLGTGKKTSLAKPASPFVNYPESGLDRMMLVKRKVDVVNMSGARVRRGKVEAEQTAVAGYGTSLVYWRLV